jgi:hypothetical protein
VDVYDEPFAGIAGSFGPGVGCCSQLACGFDPVPWACILIVYLKMESPPTGGSIARQQPFGRTNGAWGLASVHCSAPRGLIARSFEMRWTVPVPMPSDLATFKIPTPFASCFRAFRSVALSIFGRPSFTP